MYVYLPLKLSVLSMVEHVEYNVAIVRTYMYILMYA